MAGLIVHAAFVGLGVYVGTEKHRSLKEALIIGGVFGAFGVLVIALLPTIDTRQIEKLERTMIPLDCGSCHRHFTVSGVYSGRKVKCPSCSTGIVVP
jgi:DNA-directed RNA polymerase subunit RPC12/RpoP